jgi:hypothetical protein
MCRTCLTVLEPSGSPKTHRYQNYSREERARDADLLASGGGLQLAQTYRSECAVAVSTRVKVALQLNYYKQRLEARRSGAKAVQRKSRARRLSLDTAPREVDLFCHETMPAFFDDELGGSDSEGDGSAVQHTDPPPAPPTSPASPAKLKPTEGHKRAELWRADVIAYYARRRV